MLKSKTQIRFTRAELEQAGQLGINLAGGKTHLQYVNAVIELIKLLEHERPELLKKIAAALAAKTGHKLPAELSGVT